MLIVAVMLFVGSVVALLLAVLPYRPVSVYEELRYDYRGVFFPLLHDLVNTKEWQVGRRAWYLDRLAGSALPSFGRRPLASHRFPGTASPLLQAMRQRVEPMSDADVNRELMAEVLKLRDILDWESQWARLGYTLLGCELAVISVFFGLLIVISTSKTHGLL